MNLFPDIASGEAATAVGSTFAVANSDATVSVYIRTAAGSDFQYEIVTEAFLSSAAGAGGVGTVSTSTVQSELDGKAPAATTSSGIGASPYPVEYRLGRDAPPHPFEFIPPAQHNGIIAETSTYDCAPDLQRMLDGWNPDVNDAGMCLFPNGLFALGSPLRWPNWVAWRGMGRGTQLYALPGHSGPYMFQFDSDPGKVQASPISRFEQRLECFDINANGVDAIDWVIYAPSWNEKCGLRDILARKVANGFLHIDEWHGGSAGFSISDLEVGFTEAAYANHRTGINLVGKARDGGLILHKPQVTMRNVSMVGATAGEPAHTGGLTFMNIDNVHLQLNGAIHFEAGLIGIAVANGANLTGHGLSGSTVTEPVVDLIVRDANHTGQIDVKAIEPGQGTARTFKDYKPGSEMSVKTPVGARICVPSYPGQAWANGRFKVAGGAITGAPELQGCASVDRISTGYYRVSHSSDFPSGDAYSVLADVGDDTLCLAVARPSERTAGTFFIRVYRQSDGSLFDPSEVTFRVCRRPGL